MGVSLALRVSINKNVAYSSLSTKRYYSAAMMEPRSKLNEVQAAEGNQFCADCGEECPEWASINLGVFLCISCAGIHRRMSVSVSKVRSVRLDTWTEEMVESMATIGNQKAKEKFEAKVPSCWVPPTPSSRHVCREEWIRAKYERQEFTPTADDRLRPYLTGIRQGYLFKRKKQCDEWNSRWFVLSADFLTYYKSYQDRTPKASIPLTLLNVTMNGPGLDDHANSMLLAFKEEKSRKTRNIFVYAGNGKEIMDWFCSIRTAKLRLLQETFPDRTSEELVGKATRDFTMNGYICKMPPGQNKFQKRFFILDQNALRYYNRFKDPHPLGEIQLGSTSDGYYVDTNVPERLQYHENIFMLHVPNRSGGGFPLLAENREQKEAWVKALTAAITNCTSLPELDTVSTYEDDDFSESGSVTNGDVQSPPTTP